MSASRCRLFLLAVGLAAFACSPAPPPPGTALPPASRPLPAAELPPAPPSAVRGQPLYQELCARCHGASGRGDASLARPMRPRPADFTGLDLMRQATPARFYFGLRDGLFGSAMEGFADELSLQARWDVLFYVWQFPASMEHIERGRAVWRERCPDCPLPQAPQVYEMSRRDLFEQLPFQAPEADRWAAVEYLWTLVYETTLAD